MHFFPFAMTFALLRPPGPAAPQLARGPDPGDPVPVYSGGAVPECAWPTAVALYTEQGGRCTGVYVGGRVVLTAAHCIPTDYVVPNQACTSDADCPDVSSLNGAVTLECNPAEYECRDPDPLVTNKIFHAQFGSEYDHRTGLDGGLPRKSIEIAYCRQVANIPAGGMGSDSDDFGYCLLKEEPNLQAVPISTPCENAAELALGTELVAVGFGQSVDSENIDSGGTKRWATATLPDASWAGQPSVFLAGALDWTTEGGVPAGLGSGDSGGPLFARMSDGTWRVIGIAQTPFAWGIPFHHIDWLLADPNIDREDILPCHDATGAFVGGASCGATPSSPDMPSGQWDRGAHACHTDAVIPMSNLCPPAMGSGSMEPRLRAPLPPQPPGAVPPSAAAGCRAGGPAPLVVLLVRRRRGRVKAAASLRLAGIALASLLCGCPGGDDGGGPGGTLDETAGDDGCVEPRPPVILPSNPDFRGITSGTAAPPSAPWRSIARGHVDDPASTASCCEDYILGSDASPTLSVVFGAAANGFAVFGDQPTVELDAGGNVRDVALADLDGDDRSDLVALLDGQITVRLGVDAPPFFEGSFTAFSTVVGNDVGRDQLVATDTDCDGAPDILLPSDGGVVVMLNDGSGQLSPASSVPSSVSLDWVAAGDLDHDDDTDVVASASDGTVQVWIGNCGGFGAPAVYGNPQTPGTYEHTRVALGVVCPSFTSLAIAFSYGDTVDVYCGGGSGDFSNVQELHHEETPTGADFQWQPDTAFAAPRYADLAVAGAGSQQVLGLDVKENTVVALVPSTCRHRSSAYSITMPYPASLPSPLSRLVATPNPSAWGTWDRLSMVGGAGLQVIR